ncbi:O-antigen ligase family protein [Nocardioides cavernaquae]|uniref:O-antigen ligase-related domain-containing protein n=1 Tax=Nocardioides cavernaquae TaxID=2321396 RepID=A0A3A5HBK7_9ACTN|nr:O-antigen ligase family protein [Nocardioides cavernaquae]RJS45420.1 hypothetical protein D4739_03750 [Nocardioides cavernaquae]
MDTKSILLNIVGAVAALALVALTFVNTIAMLFAVVLAIGLLLVVALGPERLGAFLVLIGVFLTPINAFRPLVSPSFAWSDILLVLGFGLLLPRLLRNRARVPSLFAAGALGVVVMSVASSLVAANAGKSAYLSGFFLAAVVILPLLFSLYSPEHRQLVTLASAFVAGQVLSALVALGEGADASGRYDGLTYHSNYLGVGGVIALTLCPFLHGVATTRLWRTVILGAGALSGASVYLSGSRGCLLAIIAIAIVYPLFERSAVSAYLLFGITIGLVPLLGLIAASVAEGSALGRLLGKDPTASGSNDIRRDKLSDGWHRFLDSPIAGSGFEGNLSYHNIFLQVPIAIGVLGFAAWLVMLCAFISPLFGNSPYRRFGYVALAYLAIGLTEPLLFDRVAWVPMSFVLLAALAPSRGPTEGAESAEVSGSSATPAHPLR